MKRRKRESSAFWKEVVHEEEQVDFPIKVIRKGARRKEQERRKSFRFSSDGKKKNSTHWKRVAVDADLDDDDDDERRRSQP